MSLLGTPTRLTVLDASEERSLPFISYDTIEKSAT
jgi:hypothetical protein